MHPRSNTLSDARARNQQRLVVLQTSSPARIHSRAETTARAHAHIEHGWIRGTRPFCAILRRSAAVATLREQTVGQRWTSGWAFKGMRAVDALAHGVLQVLSRLRTSDPLEARRPVRVEGATVAHWTNGPSRAE